MRRETIVCILTGKNFSPETLSQNLAIKLDVQVRMGEIYSKGKNKGKIAPYTAARISGEHESDLDMMLEMLADNVATIKAHGVEEIYIDYVVASETEFVNLWLTANQIRWLYALKTDLLISCSLTSKDSIEF